MKVLGLDCVVDAAALSIRTVQTLCGHPDCVECHIVMEDDKTVVEQLLSVCPAYCSTEQH